MTTLGLSDFMKKKLKDKTMDETDLQRNYNYPIYPGDSKIFSNKGSVIIDNDRKGGTHWTCSIVKDNKSYYFVSFDVHPDNFLFNQLVKPIKYHKHKIQYILNFVVVIAYASSI